MVLAVVVHAVLILALTWGVNWKNTSDQPAVEAELWAAVPQLAAPKAVEPPPVPDTAPTPPAPPPVRVTPPPDTTEADIALERERKRREQEKKERAEREESDRKDAQRRERLEQEKKDRLQKEKEQREKELADKKKAEQEKQKKLAEEKRRAEAEAKQLAAQREANIKRSLGLAGATGSANATGTATRSAGPSGSYGGRVSAAVRPNIVYPDTISGNPRAMVEVRAAPDGTIVSKRLVQSSGNRAWDEAVLRALEKTGTLPRDVDGTVPSSLEIGFRPQD